MAPLFATRLAVEANNAFNQYVRDGSHAEHERAAFVGDWVSDGLADAECALAEEREAFGYPEDTPCLQSCDMVGTGEGRFHGVIGG